MNQHRIALWPWEQEALARREKSNLTRPISQQPMDAGAGMWRLPTQAKLGSLRTHQLTRWLIENEAEIGLGDELLGQEKFAISSTCRWMLQQSPPDGATRRQWLKHIVRWSETPEIRRDSFQWLEESEMPDWAIRFRLLVTDISCRPFRRWTEGDFERDGVRGFFGTAHPNGHPVPTVLPSEKYINLWNECYAEEFTWNRSLWVITYHFGEYTER